MASIKNIQGLTTNQLNAELRQGGKFVIYEYCISIVVMTFRRSSDIYFIKSTDKSFKYGIGYSILTLFLGWWGIPWGPIYSIGSIINNFKGGKDVTSEVIASIKASQNQQGA